MTAEAHSRSTRLDEESQSLSHSMTEERPLSFAGVKRLLFVVGTRPEAIKLAPVIRLCQGDSRFSASVCTTGQHSDMVDAVFDWFRIRSNYSLNIVEDGHQLAAIASSGISRVAGVIASDRPDWVIVQGDTITTWTAACAAFFAKKAVAHVEAGLRTHDRFNPFPEEMDRRLTSQLASLHFAPTDEARANLLREGFGESRIVVTGNTVVDALNLTTREIEAGSYGRDATAKWRSLISGAPFALLTTHRRENFGHKVIQISEAIAELATLRPEFSWVCPMHPNPNVSDILRGRLSAIKNVHLVEPIPYPEFVWLMSEASFIVSDSGGVQEEAPSLGKRVLLTRSTTERPEGIQSGFVAMVGTRREDIVAESLRLISDSSSIPATSNPFGDGRASERILDAIAASVPSRE